MNWGESTFAATSREAMVVGARGHHQAGVAGRPGAPEAHRQGPRHADDQTARTAVEMAEITAGPVPSIPWLPKELSTVTGISASACSPSR